MLHRMLAPLTLVSTLAFTGNAHAVLSAELYQSAPDAAFGKFEARIMYAAGDGIISSFFMWKDGSELADAYWNELDFEKLGAACELQTNSIYGNPERGHEKEHPTLTGLCDSYHTYTYEWTPEFIAWYVDGVEIRRDTGADATAYAENAPDGMQMRFNIWPGDAAFGGNFSEASLPAYEYVAWAQYSAYTPGAGDNGSDFTLSWREEFDTKPAGWSTGSWDSPKGLSTHAPANVVVKDGILVLALTADGAPGYTGTPPQDGAGGIGEGGAPATGGASSTAGGSTAASGGAVASGGISAAGGANATGGAGAGGASPPAASDSAGCSCTTGPTPSKPGALALLALASILGALRFSKRSLFGQAR